MPEYTHGDIVHHWATRAGYRLIFRYRQDRVPLTAKFRGGGGWFRSPKTLNEKKQTYVPDDDDRDLLTSHQLHGISKIRDGPTSWDDIPRRCERSWKVNRDAQRLPSSIS
jgi:hypothetical protein